MITITFIGQEGSRHDVEAVAGESVMQAARDHGLPGILADCGGACACATCHVVVADEWADRLPALGDVENEMLEFAVNREAGSRLSCQVQIGPELDGLVVRIPPDQ